jgi:hypothetical protein
MKPYDPSNWYWIVNGDETRVYSSASGDYVQPDDASYVAWSGDGSLPTRIANEAELGEVLAEYQIRPTAANVLDGYKDKHSRKITIEVVAKLLFAYANEIRALKGQSPLTAQQFRQYVKGLM